MKRLLLALLAALLAMGCYDYSAKVVPDKDLMNTTWFGGSNALKLQFVDYDIANFYNHGNDVDPADSTKSTYVKKAAQDFYLYYDNTYDQSFGSSPALPLKFQQARIGTWSVKNYVLTLVFDQQYCPIDELIPPVTAPLPSHTTTLLSYVADITKTFSLTYSPGYSSSTGTAQELTLDDGNGWSPIFELQP